MGTADDHCAARGRHHGGQPIHEYGLVFGEESCFVNYDEVSCVASE